MLLPDVLQPGLDGVLCGTAPSRASYHAAAYYAHPGNLFWPTLHRTGLTPVLLRPADYRRLPDYGLGLTDLCKTEYGSDAELSAGAFDIDGLINKLRAVRPAALALDSKTAARAFLLRAFPGWRGTPAYGRHAADFEDMAVFVLPSPSGRARGYWDIAPWHDFAAFVTARRASRGT